MDSVKDKTKQEKENASTRNMTPSPHLIHGDGDA